MPFINYTQKACVLRLGKNADVKSDRIVIGLELDPSIILSDYNLVLKFYTPFGDRTSLTCLNAPSNPEASNFFTPCEELSGDASEFKFYYNKPFNILVMGDSYIESNAFSNNLLLTMWTNFIQFFSRLFDTGISKPLPQDLTANPKITDFYIAVQGEKSITGIMEGGNNRIDVRVDYENLHSSVAILEKAAKANYPSITSEYYASGYNQTIYINGTSKPGWKLFTGLLRLNKDEGAPTFFDDVNYIPSSDWTTKSLNISINVFFTWENQD